MTCDCRKVLEVVNCADGTISLAAEFYEVRDFDGFEDRVVAETEQACSVAFVEGEIGAEGGLRAVTGEY
jgi:hypothetical protein